MTKAGEHVSQVLLLGELGYVGDTQCREIVSFELASHLLPCTATTAKMRGHVAAVASSTGTARSARRIVGHLGGCGLAIGRHGVLEGTLCGEMVAAANTALDLCALEVLLLLLHFVLVLGARLPVRHGAEDDVLGDAHSISLRSGRLALFLAKFGPRLALGDARVHDLLDDGLLDAARGLDSLAIFADGVGDDGLGAILVLDDLVLRKGLRRVLVLLFGPVGSSVVVSKSERERLQTSYLVTAAAMMCGCVISYVGFAVRVLSVFVEALRRLWRSSFSVRRSSCPKVPWGNREILATLESL
jgi:hypothetical protein